MAKHVFQGTASRPLRKRVPLANGGDGFTTVSDGWETGVISIRVDVDRIIAALGWRALDSKASRATALRGGIVVLVQERKRMP